MRTTRWCPQIASRLSVQDFVVVAAAKRFSITFDGQRRDPVQDLQNPPVLLLRHRFPARLRRSAHLDRNLRALGQGDLVFQHDHTVFHSTANDHKAIVRPGLRQVKVGGPVEMGPRPVGRARLRRGGSPPSPPPSVSRSLRPPLPLASSLRPSVSQSVPPAAFYARLQEPPGAEQHLFDEAIQRREDQHFQDEPVRPGLPVAWAPGP